MAHTRHTWLFPLLTGMVALLAAWGSRSICLAGEIEVAVFCSHRAAPYEQAVQGFKEHLTKKGIHATYTMLQIEGDEAKAAAAIERLKRNRPRMILSLGALATRHALETFSDLPVVAGLILTSEKIQDRKNATGVILDFPIDLQFQWLATFLPKCRDIGVLYNPARNHRRIEEATRAAETLGLRLRLQPVHSPSEISGAMETLAKQVDVIWSVPDDVVYTPETARHILLFSFRNAIPLIGLSETWVKAGALYALEWDYRDLGAQCGEIAEEILKGRPFEASRVRWPRKVQPTINKKAAARMNISIPESILRASRVVHE